ncbi:TPA: hypothetical protein VDU92_002367 [Pseudomonas aeruginosa]|uniref:hypothetical protein n=1 Tax=Pseudomonas aeruginosa TaxID=287 RepID=UPI0025B3C50D|nr:hypothetical protein [Pseudomonas aeruginosa]MDN3924158.1 hypothetical protein [Pseudomonas aeruginosa]MDU0529913.1 hypothetical protein [Pseudomonas aeruginosa]MED5083288.1 hypothetical protein [Pseudomonas aeruginosa]HCP6251636.1 hypothetical protein [Pseudomonas aeruginosa]HEP8977034.1 hypothetical protein [Pseudomonas aeruginosa]
MNTDLPQFEQTIIDIARQELAAVAAFYRKREAGIESAHFDEAWSEYLARYHALSTLLVLGQLPNSGMSEEGARTLREIEAEYVALRVSAN